MFQLYDVIATRYFYAGLPRQAPTLMLWRPSRNDGEI